MSITNRHPIQQDPITSALWAYHLEEPDSRRFHVVDQGEHTFVIVFHFHNQQQVNYQQFNLLRARTIFKGAPSSEDLFIQHISKFPLITLNKNENDNPPEEEPLPPATSYEHQGVLYFFSKEFQQNLLENRGNDHTISVELLQTCIQKKHKKMVKGAQNLTAKRFSFYFRVQKEENILNLVIDYFPSRNPKKPPAFTVLTAYYPTHSILKYRLEMKSEIAFENWKKQQPLIR